MIRSVLFNLSFYLLTAITCILLLPFLYLPGRSILQAGARLWAKSVLILLRLFGGIRIGIEGEEYLPMEGSYLIAAKHQSEVDGIAIVAKVPDVATIAMQELGKYPIFGRIMKKMRMILVDTEGGEKTRNSLTLRASAAVEDSRPILIYPEGQLVPTDRKAPFRKAIYHLYDDFSLPVIPVATNVGLRWPQRKFFKSPGPATIRFLPPIEAGLEKDAFMSRLEETINGTSDRLLVEQG